jgi:uncharacterized glyoxalase superfamily protein PhnB
MNPEHDPRQPRLPTVPDGYATVTSWLISADTRRLMTFLGEAFGAEDIAVLESPDGAVAHAEVRIGEVVVLLFDTPDGWPATPSHLRIYVDDADEAVADAIAAGAELVTPVSELFWGDRVGRVRDPLDNIWWIQQRGPSLSAEEIERRASDAVLGDAMELMATSLIDARA